MSYGCKNKFSEYLNKIGLKVKEVKGDGNCLFRAFSDQIEGNENNHSFFRNSAIDYMKENEDHFKFFIEDDESFEEYINNMTKEGTWGGNLEIHALSMKFSVNFYIHILDHPLLIIKNFELPFRNIHVSYHNNSHYNSVRLKEDLELDIPLDIPLELINCLEHTTNAEVIADDDGDSEDGNIVNLEEKEENKFLEDKKFVKNEEKEQEYVSFGINVKDINRQKNVNVNFNKSIMTRDGLVRNEISDNKKCHCASKKKYRNCCLSEDIKGEYDAFEKIFYCDIEDFKKRFYYEIKDVEENTSTKSNSKDEIESLAKKVDIIYI